MSKHNQADEHEPNAQEARQAFNAALIPVHTRVRAVLGRLMHKPPQVLLVEGALEEERRAMAKWYAALINCPHASAGEKAAPCLECPTCLQIGGEVFADLHVLDGGLGRIKIDTVREVRALLGEAPHGGGVRVIVLAEAQALGLEAANALLKSLEEPCPGTVFVLLTPQRERLLPTLVSRSWTVTMAWPDTAPVDNVPPWGEALVLFIQSGSGWLDAISGKGAVDAALARRLLLAVQKWLTAEAAGRVSEYSSVFAVLNRERLFVFDLLSRAQETLEAGVNPALVLGWLATQLHVVFVRAGGRALRQG